MKKWLQRIRGAIGIGLTWAAGWAPIGAITGWVTGVFLGFPLGVVTANYDAAGRGVRRRHAGHCQGGA
jgi:hypothetical protein